MTFYKSVERPAAVRRLQDGGRTYRFFNGTPLYPFGHGLSYTTFAYTNLSHDAPSRWRVRIASTVSVDVTNTGAVAGDEVVQLYVQHDGSKVERPIRICAATASVAHARRETKTVTMRVSWRKSLRVLERGQRHRWVVGGSEPIRLTTIGGGDSADIRLEKTIGVQSTRRSDLVSRGYPLYGALGAKRITRAHRVVRRLWLVDTNRRTAAPGRTRGTCREPTTRRRSVPTRPSHRTPVRRDMPRRCW